MSCLGVQRFGQSGAGRVLTWCPTCTKNFDELRFYAEHFDTVEVNSSFYRMPEASMSTAWPAVSRLSGSPAAERQGEPVAGPWGVVERLLG